MAAQCCRAAAPVAATSLPLATKEPFVTQSKSFPKSSRVLKSSDFRKIYDGGVRSACRYFAAFCLKSESAVGPKIGFTTPRALGKAVVRNRIRRRLREVIRQRLELVDPHWEIVFNPRRAAEEAAPADLAREVERLFSKCRGS